MAPVYINVFACWSSSLLGQRPVFNPGGKSGRATDGALAVLAVYLFSGVVGSVTAVALGQPAVMVGASGAISGFWRWCCDGVCKQAQDACALGAPEHECVYLYLSCEFIPRLGYSNG